MIPITFRLIISLFFVVTLTTNVAWASYQEDSNAPRDECEQAGTCINQSEWQIGVAVGLGAKSNPLVDSDAIPQVVLLDIAWYGENAYFDNGEIGYKFIQTEALGLESYLTIDREAAFFKFWHPGNIFAVGPGQGPPPIDVDPADQDVSLSLDNVASRKWAVNAGLRTHFYGDNYEWSLSAEHDVSSVHKGYKAILSYQYSWQGNDWHLSVRPTLIWKSDKLVDYYYGLSEKDRIISSQMYNAKGGVQPAISVLYSKHLNENWQWILSTSYQKLHTGMTDSPLVKSDNITSLFLGAGYQF